MKLTEKQKNCLYCHLPYKKFDENDNTYLRYYQTTTTLNLGQYQKDIRYGDGKDILAGYTPHPEKCLKCGRDLRSEEEE